MPGSSSAQKRARGSEKSQLRNKSRRSQCKTLVSKAEASIFSGELKPAEELVTEATSALDHAAGKGVLHPNNAARRKSRLMKKLNEARAKI